MHTMTFHLPEGPCAAARRLATLSLAGLLALSGCNRAPEADETALNVARPQIKARAQPSTSSVSTTPKPQAAAPLSERIAQCAPPDGGSPWAESGRVADQNRTYVMLARGEDPARLDGALVMLAEGGCQADLLGSEVSSAAGADMPRLDDAAYARLVDQDFQWRVNRSGSVEELARKFQEGDSSRLLECEPGAYAGCVPTWIADRFRARRVAVDPPGP